MWTMRGTAPVFDTWSNRRALNDPAVWKNNEKFYNL